MATLQTIKQRFGIVGQSPLLHRALSTAERVANTDLSVLITGESGVGKEVFSKIIHSLSHRKHNNFIAINCGAIPEGTINSELFGHEKGAFTGATTDRKGYFETYDGGTVFLDEIGEMPLDTQAYLLRVLESGEYIRVGSSKVQRTDVRIIAATNVDLKERIQKGKFREDLYYRLNTVAITVPPLRERKEDIFMLFRKFTVDVAEKYHITPVRLDDRAKLLLENYNWPGNIRELKNLAEKVSILSEEREISAEQLLDIFPTIKDRHLPALTKNGKEDQGLQEREILYKLLFDMKSDLNDLKSLIYELIRDNDLQVPDNNTLKTLTGPVLERDLPSRSNESRSNYPGYTYDHEEDEEYEEERTEEDLRPMIIREEGRDQDEYGSVEIIDENLSLEYHEKNLIEKALKKHNGRRKDAAEDLGISERTLYRKIKQYNLQ
jgi:DNA-binding NtrC family response regulator